MVLTAPSPAKRPVSSNFRNISPHRKLSTLYHLHLYKSPAPNEREVERLQINGDSLVFISDEEIAGKRSVVKIVGLDVGGRRKGTTGEGNGQTMGLVLFLDSVDSQSWIDALKNAAADQRYIILIL